MIYKRCTSCDKDRLLIEFRKQLKNKDGLKYTCKICDDKKARKRYVEKKEHIIATVKKWQEKQKKKPAEPSPERDCKIIEF